MIVKEEPHSQTPLLEGKSQIPNDHIFAKKCRKINKTFFPEVSVTSVSEATSWNN